MKSQITNRILSYAEEAHGTLAKQTLIKQLLSFVTSSAIYREFYETYEYCFMIHDDRNKLLR